MTWPKYNGQTRQPEHLWIISGNRSLAIICIITDSFFPSGQARPYFTLFLIVIAANLMIFLLNLADGTPMATNGLFNTHSLNLFAVIALIPIYVTLLAKYLYDKKHAETE